jgi:pyruvate,water dikinase
MTISIPIDAASERAVHGGKAANLAFLVRLGLNVPAARVVPADEFTRQVEACGGRDFVSELAARDLRPELAAELRALVAELGGRVSVRSSATLEDARTHSFAGQFLTVLNVGSDGVEARQRCIVCDNVTRN